MNPANLSKINWTNGVSFVVAVAAVFGFVIPDAYQHQALELAALATPLATMVLRTWFTGNKG